jgi:hypothetical protein
MGRTIDKISIDARKIKIRKTWKRSPTTKVQNDKSKLKEELADREFEEMLEDLESETDGC